MQQEQVDWFESWFGSPYYHILYEHRDEFEAQAFVDQLIDYLQPPPGSKMVDIACGEGRYAVQLASRGFDVTGIDLSYESIEKAKKSEGKNLQFLVHDMRFPFYINYFDYAFNFFTSFGYFAAQRDHLMAAKAFGLSLKKGGLLVIDYLNREYTLARMQPESTVRRGDYEFQIKKRLEDGHIVKDISFRDSENKLRNYRERVAAFSLSDFVRMFREAGLSLIGTYGDYALNPYHPFDSPRMIMTFKK